VLLPRPADFPPDPRIVLAEGVWALRAFNSAPANYRKSNISRRWRCAQTFSNGSTFTVFSVAPQRSWKNSDLAWESRAERHRLRHFRQAGRIRSDPGETRPHAGEGRTSRPLCAGGRWRGNAQIRQIHILRGMPESMPLFSSCARSIAARKVCSCGCMYSSNGTSSAFALARQ
jgi:hypothetical protein